MNQSMTMVGVGLQGQLKKTKRRQFSTLCYVFFISCTLCQDFLISIFLGSALGRTPSRSASSQHGEMDGKYLVKSYLSAETPEMPYELQYLGQ